MHEIEQSKRFKKLIIFYVDLFNFKNVFFYFGICYCINEKRPENSEMKIDK